MCSWALCYVALCLLGADAEIYQRRFLLAGAGRDVTLECKQSLRYNAMFWYPQDPGLGLRLIYYSTVEKDVQRGDISEGYSVSREEKGLFPLTVKLAHINQTALYVCSGSAPRWNTATAHRCTNPLQPCGPHYSLYLKCFKCPSAQHPSLHSAF
ncbi:T-cell receptor beta chain V region LB2 precursor-like protein [Camelus ferus]|nr:T-cell receptor beta chain V region LB2 precursor-like protein [Camelus ferus]